MTRHPAFPSQSPHLPFPQIAATPRSRRPGTPLETYLEAKLGPALSTFAGQPILWLRRVRLRHELAGLREAQLRDVGLDPAMIGRECAKHFWQE